MKSIVLYLVILLPVVAGRSEAQRHNSGSFSVTPSTAVSMLIDENFDYPSGDSLNTHGWTVHSGAGITPITVSLSGLTFPGYSGSGIGNAATVNGTGEDVSRSITVQNQSGGVVFLSALVNITETIENATGGYFLHLGAKNPTTPSSMTMFCARIHVRFLANSVNFGLSNASATAQYSSHGYVNNTTYLVILKHRLSSAGNDTTQLWVFDSGVPLTEQEAPAPILVVTDIAVDSVNAVAIRQTSSTPDLMVDGIRIGTTWEGVTTGSIALTAPENLSVTAGNGLMKLRWNSMQGAKFKQYIIYGGTAPNSMMKIDSTEAGNIKDTTLTVTGLTNGVPYYFEVRAIDSAMIESGPSNIASATPAVLSTAKEYNADIHTVLLLHLNEAEGGNVSDASLFNNSGIATGTIPVAGKNKNARLFNGTSEWLLVQQDGSLNISDQLTLEAWVYVTKANAFINLFSKEGAYQCYVENDGRFSIGIFSGYPWHNVRSKSVVPQNQWVHVAGTFNNSTKRFQLYLNGVLENDSIDAGAALTISSHPLYIGRNGSANVYHMGGMMDDIRISSIVRTPDEFNLQLPPRNLSATLINSDVNLSWTNGGGAAAFMQYNIYRGIDSLSMTKINSSSIPSFTNTGLAIGSTHYYRISSVDSSGFEGAKSFAVRVTVSHPQGLIAWYKFDGTADDSSGYGYHGTNIDATPTTDRFGILNSALSFDGVNSYVKIADPGKHLTFEANTDSYSCSMWAKFSSMPGRHIHLIMDRLSSGPWSYYLNFDAINKTMFFFPFDNSAHPQNNHAMPDIATGTWYHFITVTTNKTVSLYINGMLVQTGMLPPGFSSTRRTDNEILVGAFGNSPSDIVDRFGGSIDDIRIYNRALDAGEVAALYHAQGYDDAVPDAPKNLEASAASGALYLKWNKVADSNLRTYRIYAGTAVHPTSVVDSTNAGQIDDTTIVLHNVTDGQVYFLRVSAVDSLEQEGAYSNELQMAPTIVSNGLLAYYPFNGNARDGSGFGVDPVSNNAVLSADRFGTVDGAYAFDGSSTYLYTQAVNLLDTLSQGSLSLWFKTPAIVQDEDLFAYSTDANNVSLFSLQIHQSKIWFTVKHHTGKQPYYLGTTILQPNAWYSVVLVQDGNGPVKLFLNGKAEELLYEDDGSGANGNIWFSSIAGVASNDHYLSVGALRRGGFPEGFFSGSIDDIRIYRRPLGAVDIDSLYHAGDWGQTPKPIEVSIPSIIVTQYDTLSIPIQVRFPKDSTYSSFELEVSGFSPVMHLVGIDTSSTLLGSHGWLISMNANDSVIQLAGAGSTDIEGEGTLVKLRFLVQSGICNTIMLKANDVTFNTGLDSVSLLDGAVSIKAKPSYGDVDGNGVIQAFDASLLLKYLVGEYFPDCQSLANADVTINEEVTAFDASVILQYIVKLIPSLPFDSSTMGSSNAEGVFALRNSFMNNVGDIIEVPLVVEKGRNISSFEGKLSFDAEKLEFVSMRWDNDANEYIKEVHSSEGAVRIIGAGVSPMLSSGSLGAVRFKVKQHFTETRVRLTELRLNEDKALKDCAEAIIHTPLSIQQNTTIIPKEFAAYQNYPNPFNPTTTISFSIAQERHTRLAVYNVLGQEVAVLVSTVLAPNIYSLQWDASLLPSGVYFYTLHSGEFTSIKRMLLAK